MRGAQLPSIAPAVLRRAPGVITSAPSHSATLPVGAGSSPGHATPAPGNVVVVVLVLQAAASTITAEPAGYTRLFAPLQRGASAFTLAAWIRKAQAGDSGTITVGHTTTVNGVITAYELVNVADPAVTAPLVATVDGGAATVTTLAAGIGPTAFPGLTFVFVATGGNATAFGNAWDGQFRRGYIAGGANRLAEARRLTYATGETLATHETWTAAQLAMAASVHLAAA